MVGDGMTLALLNPGTAATSVGENGDGPGFGGLNGLALILGTQQVTGAPSGRLRGNRDGHRGHGGQHGVSSRPSWRPPYSRAARRVRWAAYDLVAGRVA
ncbi:MAG TPA: hypothetical protein VHZ03_39360 [Trebonia sp.]|nr:hypothetical protein [Trebonia sp.]